MIFLSNLSRRKFIYLGTGAVIAVGTGLYAKEVLLPQLLEPEHLYPQALFIEQSISPKLLEYPPIKSSSFEVTIKLRNTAPVPIENVVLEQSGLKGFSLNSAEYQNKELTNVQIDDNGELLITIPEEAFQSGKLEINLIFDVNLDSQTSEITTSASGQYFQEGKFGFGDRYFDTKSNQPQSSLEIIQLPETLRELCQQGKQEWVEEILDRQILLQYPVQADLQEKYWKNPSQENAEILVQFFISELQEAGEPYTKLVDELQILPDLQNPEYDADLVKAFENITSICLIYDASKENIQEMLDEGIKLKRKYCTPLQALLWLGKKELWSKLNNPMKNYSAKSLFTRTWDFADKKEWEDFAVVTDRLNFPEAVGYYMYSRISYRYYIAPPGGIQIAMDIFNKKSGNCSHQASFFNYCLNKNGYYARPLEIAEITHVVSLYRDKDGRFYVHDNSRKADPTYEIVKGPFSSIEVNAAKTAKNAVTRDWLAR